MPVVIPDGVVPVRSLTTSDVLYGDRTTEYRWEVLAHDAGSDHLVGYLDGVVSESASLSWVLNAAIKGSGSLRVTDLVVGAPGMMRIADVPLESARLRPVLIVDGLPEIPLGVYLPVEAPEDYDATGRTVVLDLLDRSTVLAQDEVEQTYAVAAGAPVLAAVATVIASAGESIAVDASVTTGLASAMVWPAGTSKLTIVNDLLDAIGYSSLWVDGVGSLRATPYVVPARRSITYEVLAGVARELVDGDTSIYEQAWSRGRDWFGVPNKVIAVQAGSGDTEPQVGVWTNTDPGSPFSYPSRGRWIVRTLDNVEVPDFSGGSDPDGDTTAFLQTRARQSLIAASSVQASVSVRHLPIPLRVSDVVRFANAPAGIDARHIVTSIKLDAHPLGLMQTELQEVIDL